VKAVHVFSCSGVFRVGKINFNSLRTYNAVELLEVL